MRPLVIATLVLLSGCALHNQGMTMESYGSSIQDATMPHPGMEAMQTLCSQRKDLCPTFTARQASPGPFLPSPY